MDGWMDVDKVRCGNSWNASSDLRRRRRIAKCWILMSSAKSCFTLLLLLPPFFHCNCIRVRKNFAKTMKIQYWSGVRVRVYGLKLVQMCVKLIINKLLDSWIRLVAAQSRSCFFFLSVFFWQVCRRLKITTLDFLSSSQRRLCFSFVSCIVLYFFICCSSNWCGEVGWVVSVMSLSLFLSLSLSLSLTPVSAFVDSDAWMMSGLCCVVRLVFLLFPLLE